MLKRFGGIFALCAITALLAWVMRNARFDDPFITYRFAENLGNGSGFQFNRAGVGSLITTSPAYAVVLALAHMAGMSIPVASYAIGVASLLSGGLLLSRRGRVMAGLSFVCSALMWLTVGFETPMFIAVVLGAYALLERGLSDAPTTSACTGVTTTQHQRTNRWLLIACGALLGLALGLRGDALIPIAIALILPCATVNGFRVTGRNLGVIAWMLLGIAASYGPLCALLLVRFGSPIPTTLATKTAQAASGLTGFYTGTSFPGGLLVLGTGALQNNIGLLLVIMLFVIGCVHALTTAQRLHNQEGSRQLLAFLVRPATAPAWWALAHLLGYTAIGVAPYVWYYAPMIPGAALMLGHGVSSLARFAQRYSATRVGSLLIIGFLIALAISLWQSALIWNGATPPDPALSQSKVLPETKVFAYEQVGRWIATNTPETATLGVTELGVMSFYAQRQTIDFLGLVSPVYRDAVRHGDYLQTLLREQPDYVALTSVNPLYLLNPQREDWFKALYRPIQSIEDARFWGSPITIYERQKPAITSTVQLNADNHDLGDGWQVTGVDANARSITANDPLVVQLKLRAGKPLGSRVLQVQPIYISGGDGLPVTGRVINTSLWRTGEEAWLDFPLLAPASSKAGVYVISANWQGSPNQIMAGFVKVGALPAPVDATAIFAPLSQGVGVQFLTKPIEVCSGAAVNVPLTWRGGLAMMENYTVFLHLRNSEAEKPLSQADGPPSAGTYPTSVWGENEAVPDDRFMLIPPSVQPGDYSLVVGLYLPIGGQRLSVVPSDYSTADNGVKIGTVRVQKCQQ